MGRACATCCLRRAARTIARVATTRRRTLSTAGAWFHPDWVFADVRKNPIVRGVTFSGGNRSYRAESLRRWQSACALRVQSDELYRVFV